jgi:hypothetical protein
MTIEQTIEIPANHRLDLHLDLPPEFPAGKTILTFTPASVANAKAWRSLYGICKNSGDTLDAFLERKHVNRARENTALERRLQEMENRPQKPSRP